MTDEEFISDVERYKNMLFRLACNNTGDISCCDDIVQDVFLKYLKCRKSFPNEESKKYWLIRVTINKCRDHTSLFWNKRRREFDSNAEYKEDVTADEKIALREALKKLPPKYRDVVFLYYYEGYTTSQIASILKVSTSAITSRLQRAREMLKKYLE